MRFLVYEWTSYLKCDLYDILKEKGLSYQTFRWSFKNKNEDDDFFMWFAENVETSFFDALISINYWPLLSEVCQKYHLRYIAWCYDCPLNVERIEETLANQINYVFLFDQMQFYKYKNAGFDTVYHLPLGVNATRVAKYSFSDKDLEKYRCDVS